MSANKQGPCPPLSQLRFLAKAQGRQAVLLKKDLCSCKHSIALYIPFLLHIYMSWLKHKSFFCKDVGFWSEFTYLVEKMLKVLILIFSSLHFLLMTVTGQHQFKGQPNPENYSHQWKMRGLLLFYPFLPACPPPDHITPSLCHAGLGPVSTTTSTWRVMGSHVQEWDLWVRKVQISSGQSELHQLTASPEAIRTSNTDWLAKAPSSKAHKPKQRNHPSSLQSSYALCSACVLSSAG